MFDKTSFNLKAGDNIANVSLNTPSTGMIQKSSPRSRFINVKKNSNEFNCLFPKSFEEVPCIEITKRRYREKPAYYEGDYWTETIKKEVTILQCMVYGQDEFFVEYVINDELEENIEKV